MSALIPRDRIKKTILVIRGHKVMVDADLAELYGVSTKVLNQAVKRNNDRFPKDFIFRLTNQIEILAGSAIRLYRTWRSDGGKRPQFKTGG